MTDYNFETLSQATNALTEEGFKEDFQAEEKTIKANFSKKDYAPEELKIIRSFRFDGVTNPADETTVFAIEANDGTKGTLIMSYSADHNQNSELIKRIPVDR